MNNGSEHPVDFGPFLSGESSDPDYAAIREHLAACSQCRREVHDWKALDALFRTADPIEVPPFGWSRLSSRLQERQSGRPLARLRRLLVSWRPAWAIPVVVACCVAGWMGIRPAGETDAQVLFAIGEYTAKPNPSLDSNPFQAQKSADRDESNPFSIPR